MSKHPIHRVTSFDFVGDYMLRVHFEDETCQEIDFSPVLHGELYGPLQELSIFNQVQLDPEVHTLVWPNGADFDPATLHDWPVHADAFAEMAAGWSDAPAKTN